MTLTDKFKERFALFIYHFIFLFMLTIFFVGIFVISPKEKIFIQIDSPEQLSTGWINCSNSQPIEKDSIIIPPNQSVEIEHTVPDGWENTAALGVWNFYLHIEAFVGNRKIFEWGSEEPPEFGMEAGAVWNVIKLTELKGNEKIKLKLYNPCENRIFDLTKIYFGSENEIDAFILKQSNMTVLIVLSVMILVVIMLFYMLILKHYGIREYIPCLGFLLILAVDSCAYFVCESNLPQFFNANPSIRYLLSYFTIFSVPLFLMLFMRSYFQSGKKVLLNLLNVYGVMLFAILLLYITDIVHIKDSVYVIHVWIPVLIIVAFYLVANDYRITKDKTNSWFCLAFLILSLATVANVLFFYIKGSPEYARIFRDGFSAFIVILLVTIMRKSLAKLSDVHMAARYKQIAYTDSVTGGYSRVYFSEKLNDLKITSNYFLYINLMQFKVINQIIGRKKSDELLRIIYYAINETLNEKEILCSLGNARYAVCVDADDLWLLHSRCMLIRDKINFRIKDKKLPVNVLVQLSACEINPLHRNLTVLLDNCLMAVQSPLAEYFSDINCYVYNDRCKSQLLNDKLLEDHLESGIEKNEFRVFLQPKISLKTGKIEAAESLVRWIHPERGLLAPDNFIPLFERDGQIEKLDLYLFYQVCLLINKWNSSGYNVPVVSVNISKVAINHDGYFDRYLEIMQRFNVPGKYIEFELTESIVYNDINLLQEILGKIHNAGSTCSMDDFGKSYSNINALASFPFDSAKMDKCFFDNGFPEDKKKYNLVSGTLSLLHTMRLKVIAEGIENENQVTALSALGCDEIQGYYYAKPMPVEDFEKKLFGK